MGKLVKARGQLEDFSHPYTNTLVFHCFVPSFLKKMVRSYVCSEEKVNVCCSYFALFCCSIL